MSESNKKKDRKEDGQKQRLEIVKSFLAGLFLLGVCVVVLLGLVKITNYMGQSAKEAMKQELLQEKKEKQKKQKEKQEAVEMVSPKDGEKPQELPQDVVHVIEDDKEDYGHGTPYTEEEEKEALTFTGIKNRLAQEKLLTAGERISYETLQKKMDETQAKYSAYLLDVTRMEEYQGADSEQAIPADALVGIPVLFTLADLMERDELQMDSMVTWKENTDSGEASGKYQQDTSYPVSEVLERALLGKETAAWNALMERITLEEINSTCHSYGYDSVDVQRMLTEGPSTLENSLSAKDAALMMNALYHDNMTSMGKEFWEKYLKTDRREAKDQGMFSVGKECDTFLSISSATDSRHGEIGLFREGDECFILAALTSDGAGKVSAEAVKSLANEALHALRNP